MKAAKGSQLLRGIRAWAERRRRSLDGRARTLRTHWRKTALAAVTGLSLSLGGCHPISDYIHNGFKVGPNYQRPPAATAEHWIDADDPRVHSQPVDDSHWWSTFNDPVLECLVQSAY